MRRLGTLAQRSFLARPLSQRCATLEAKGHDVSYGRQAERLSGSDGVSRIVPGTRAGDLATEAGIEPAVVLKVDIQGGEILAGGDGRLASSLSANPTSALLRGLWMFSVQVRRTHGYQLRLA